MRCSSAAKFTLAAEFVQRLPSDEPKKTIGRRGRTTTVHLRRKFITCAVIGTSYKLASVERERKNLEVDGSHPMSAETCNPPPCNEKPFTNAWWNDNNCITASGACCYQGVQAGQEHYEYETPQAY